MNQYDFCLYLDADDMPDELVEKLYEDGCDDGTFGVSNGEAFAAFSRQGPSLESAILSAAAHLRKAGLRITRVEIEAEDLAALESVQDA